MSERRLSARRRDGTSFPIEVSISKLVRDDEVFMTAVIRDVSERIALEEKLRHAQDVEATGRLASSVVHDLANLLTIVQHAAELVRRDAGHADPTMLEPIAPHVDAITASVSRGAALTRRLLGYARSRPSEPAFSSLDDVIGRARELIQHCAGEAVRVELSLAAPDAVVCIDEIRFEHVLLNCVANARDAMPGGGGVAIRTKLTEDAGKAWVVLEIEDNGPGMEPEVATRAFEPFFSTKESSRGSGLGLWTARDVVRASGGSIDLAARAGAGTLVSIRLPCERRAKVVRDDRSTPSAEAPVSARVLLVDDEEALRKLLARALRLRGFEVVTASGAGDALALLESGRVEVDVLVTDAVMPIMSGPELADRMQRFVPRLRTLYVTGHADDELLRRGIPREAVLSKPFTSDELVARIARVLGE